MTFWGRIKDDERGVTAVVVAVTLVAIFGAAMLSVDAGNLWQSRRNMVTGTDAAALGEAQIAALNGTVPCGVGSDYQLQLQRNSGNAVFDPTCTPFIGPLGTNLDGTGYVTVSARKPVDVRFGGVVGVGDTAAYSSSTAQWGFIVELKGLRPIAVCDKTANFQLWNQLHPALGTPTITQAAYDAFFGTTHTALNILTPATITFPRASTHYIKGKDNDNPNAGLNYVTPTATNDHHLIHRITMPDLA